MEALHLLRERLENWLNQMGLAPEHPHDGPYLLRYGSTVVLITLFAEGEETYCRFASLVLKDFEPSLELLQRILKLNTEVLFGSFLLFEDDTLSFSATLLGNHLDLDQFQKTLEYVARVSDDYDDELQQMGGGKRAEDVLRDES